MQIRLKLLALTGRLFMHGHKITKLNWLGRTEVVILSTSKGFTLIELTFTLLIICFLATISISNIISIKNQFYMVEALTIVDDLKVSIGEYYAFYGIFPKTNKEAAVPQPEDLYGANIERINLEDGAIHIVFFKDSRITDSIDKRTADSSKANQAILSIRPVVVADSQNSGLISWVCGYALPPVNMVAVGENYSNLKKAALPTTCW